MKHPESLTCIELKAFSELAEGLEKARAPGGKHDSDLLVQVAEWTKLYRKVTNIKTMSRVFVGDVDKITDAQVERLLEALVGTSSIIYTTHSHLAPEKDGLNCYRILVELDREYLPEEHERVWEAANRRLFNLLDPGARTPEQGYYLPAYPEERAEHSELHQLPGEPWGVDELLSEASDPTEEPELEDLMKRLSLWANTRKEPNKYYPGKWAMALLEGKNTIQIGEGRRNDTMIRVAGLLAAAYPQAPAEALAEFFDGEGWNQFNLDGKYPLGTFVDAIQRMQDTQRAKDAAAKKARRQELTAAVKAGSKGERDYLITSEEIQDLERMFPNGWKRHIIAMHKKDHYFLRPDGSYGPKAVCRESFFVAARDTLAVFGDEIEYTYTNSKGQEVEKRYQAFVQEYATVINDVVYDMTVKKGGYDSKRDVLVFPAGVPVVEPAYHSEVQAWIDLLDPHLSDWLAVSPSHERMLPALVMTGPADCGKTLLALGAGQIYEDAPLDAEEAFSNFNGAMLTRQPIIFMDEKTASAYRQEGTTLLRRFLTQRVRRLDEKYQARTELHGYVRVIIAANNLDVLNTKEEMSYEDRKAFAERLIHVELAPGQDYLSRYQSEIQKNWLDNRWLAEHFLWLSQNHDVQNPGKRFAVAGNHTPLHNGLASRSGIAGDVAYWLLMYLLNPERVDKLPVQYDPAAKSLRVNASAVVEGWGFYLRGQHPPTPSAVGRALSSMSLRGRQKIKQSGGKTVNAYDVDPHLLRNANDRHGLIHNFDELFF